MAAETPSLDTVFCAAIDIASADDRAAYIARTCGDDRELQARVEKLVDAHFRAGSFLEESAPAPGATGSFVSPSLERLAMAERPGTVIGPYKLLQQIGEGGMGAVFMAEQTEPVRRKVALKLIKPGMDSGQVTARFEAERQALALMEHPNIAHVFDGGATEGGRPYFVMELVKGMPLTKYCDEHKLTPKQRLELFTPVCQAVQHAHQKGVIHRDLKPSNVLVALYDGKPVPKVIDFGVAKAAGQPLTDKTLFTAFGSVVGTLEYMSPEQAELNQLDIDTRSDVYSLGVMLYELLTGTTPLERRRLKDTGLVELLRLIREEEPPRPSARLSTTAELPAIAASRGLEPKKLSGAVRGELDWIVMKALEKDRDRRYETANGFAQDIQRYLADEPVQACPPSAWYRLRKFARRNRTALVTTAVLGVALMAAVGAAAGSIGWVTRDREARRARLASQVEQILKDVDRLEGEQKWPEALAAADRAEAALSGGEADDAVRRRVSDARRDPEFVARLERIRQDTAIRFVDGLNDIGAAPDYEKAFRDYGVDVKALPAEEAVARLRRNPALAAPVAAALDDWGSGGTRRVGEEEPPVEWLAAVARGLDPSPLRDRLRALRDAGITLQRTPEKQAELRQLAESIDVRAHSPATLLLLAPTRWGLNLLDVLHRTLRVGQCAHPADFWLNYELGRDCELLHDYAGAVQYFSIAVSLRPDCVAARDSLGSALYNQKRLDEAVAEYRQAVELDPNFAITHLGLGHALHGQQKLNEAAAEFRKAIELDPNFVEAHTNLGNVLRDQGKLGEAVAEHRQAIAIMAMAIATSHCTLLELQDKGWGPTLAADHFRLGCDLHDQGKLEEAAAEYRKAIECDPNAAGWHGKLGNVLLDQKKLEEAAAEYRKAIECDPKEGGWHGSLGNALTGLGKAREAAAECRRALELNPGLALAHTNLGNALYDLGDVDEAIACYRMSIELEPTNADVHYDLGNALNRQGKPDEAAASCRIAIELDPRFAKAHNSLGNALLGLGKADEAEGAYRKAIELRPDFALAHCNLGEALQSQGKVREALEELRRGHELGSKTPDWNNPSAEWVRQCERLVELDGKLPGFLDGKTAPASPGERIELAGLCSLKSLNAAAARFYEEAFAAEPKLADDLGAFNRYNAACAAAQAGCGRGSDAGQLDDKERARLRGEALPWLHADLAAQTERLVHGKPADQVNAQAALRHWLEDADLAGVRGPEALALLPEAERGPWQKLWDDVADALSRAQDKATAEKKSK